MDTPTLAIPVKLDAFVLNKSAADGEARDRARIAPITQPNYSYLRLQDSMLQPDILNPIQLHDAAPSSRNSRITELGSGQTREHRLGVYLHWMIPRPYRIGNTATHSRKASVPHINESSENSADAPTFPAIPNRWLVIRRITSKLPPNVNMDPVKAWVVESDWMRLIDELEGEDLQTDVSPFLWSPQSYMDGSKGPSIEQQAEVFIGGRTPASSWKEQGDARKRVPLSVLNSSNQLFPDYQPHNSNVFSIIDTFEFGDGKGQTGKLAQATADYYVIGWHDKTADDPLHNISDNGDRMTRGECIGDFKMEVNNADDEKVAAWLKSTEDARVVCHGAMYEVQWHDNWTDETRPRVLADKAACEVSQNMPVAIGTTPIDAMLAYVAAHQGTEIEQDLYALGALLRAQDESIDSRRAGSDEVQNYNFARFAGGKRYTLNSEPGKPAAPPSKEAGEQVNRLNQSQSLLDSAARWLKQSRWDLFSVWWKYVTDLDRGQARKKDQYSKQVEELRGRFLQLSQVIQEQQTAVGTIKTRLTEMGYPEDAIKEAVLPEFHQQLDPTLFLGGVKAGWPSDYLDALKVRIDFQIPAPPEDDPGLKDYGIDCLPEYLRPAGRRLLNEFQAPPDPLDASRAQTPGIYPPLYSDGRDRWSKTQPWFPLFMEWEAEYYHVPYDCWEMDEYAASQAIDKRFRHVIKQDEPLWEKKINDRRRVSGRILILPQPVFSLQANITRLFETVPPEKLDLILPKDARDRLRSKINELSFISAPLDGFADHLATLAPGSHLKPNVRYPGGPPRPMEDAWRESSDVGLGEDKLKQMGTETDLTPYASLVGLRNRDTPAMKPAVHGQFKLTRVNVIDKFGQAVCVVDPTRRPQGPSPIYPCLSEYYAPQAYRDTKLPNVVEQGDEPDEGCQFVQMPPAINQPARLNMEFVRLASETTASEPYWRPVSEWENPIWGWVVVNYANYGLQFFLPNGTFYREVRIAQRGTVASAEWLPFERPDGVGGAPELDKLITALSSETDSKYLLDFIGMISKAVGESASAPSAYSECVTSLVGKPFALVHAGVSLELSDNARRNQSSIGNQATMPLPYELLQKPRSKQYEFQVKLGDRARPHDGLVGYFQTPAALQSGAALDFKNLYTYFSEPTANIHPIDKSTMPKLKPFWANPQQYTTADAEGKAKEYFKARNNALSVFAFIMDPFTAVNAYSSILPIQPLKLPTWTWESALRSMTAFFHFGPIVVPEDVPAFLEEKRLQADYDLRSAQSRVDSLITMPAIPVAEWSWLQPYDVPDKPPQTSDVEGISRFMALNLAQLDPRPKFESGPRAALEGYLQMNKPFTQNDPKKGF
ncbi:hypothetical protein BDW62DRAFT_196835 [Aspergillus aurantiobrunneus]